MEKLVPIACVLASVVLGCSSGSGSGSAASDSGSGEMGGDGGIVSPEPDASIADGGGGSDAPGPSDAMPDSSSATDGTSPPPHDAGAEASSPYPGYVLAWSDEFDGPDGSAPDPTKWTYDIGGGGWGNQEREYYTNSRTNSVIQGGDLVITATTDGASAQSCWYGTCLYTSARLKTQGLFAQAYGRFEARAQMPFGQGLWPAIWMLGDNIDTGSWPTCGEIDFLETIGSDITNNHGSLHAPNWNPTATYPLPGGQKYSDAFHTFAVEWDPGTVRFYVDDMLYETQDQGGASGAGGTWEFDHPFFLIANVAVGGTWPGDPDSTTTFPQTLKVDYVRVYQRTNADP
jgi:beta-glucanase (GH16 family)